MVGLECIVIYHIFFSVCFFYSQGSNSRKRKRGGDSLNKTLDVTPKRSKQVRYQIYQMQPVDYSFIQSQF